MLLTTPPWHLAPGLPWKVFTSPAEKWAVQPSFVIGEWLFLLCAALAFLHAWRQPGDPLDNQRRRHLLAWAAALVAGTANDLIFMTLPLVDNFWQAQATIMITPRLPLYIPCVYVCFMYFPTVSVWRLRLPALPAAALSGLLGSLFYAPYDIVGAKFLWWTWHDSDGPIANRLLGAPVGSTMWVITFVAGFSWLLTRVVERDRAVARRTVLAGLAWVAGCSTLIMMLQMTVLQQLDGGSPGVIGLCVVVALYGAGIAFGWGKRRPDEGRAADRLLHGAAVLYFVTLTVIMAVFDPETHRSASLHQSYGPCHVESIDITGKKRFKYVCAEDFAEDYVFSCMPSLPAPESDWYTVCGRPHVSYGRWLTGVAVLGALGMAAYSYLLSGRMRRR